MSNNYLVKIMNELQSNIRHVNHSELEYLSDKIIHANHIFLAGAGRSGITVKAFANRLMHLGFSVSLVGDICSPHSKEGDLLIICSGSGETDSLKTLVKKAKNNKVEIALVTMKPDSTIGQLADLLVILPGHTKDQIKPKKSDFSQPMGTSFEQLSFLIFDSLVLTLMDKMGETSDTMYARHADFE